MGVPLVKFAPFLSSGFPKKAPQGILRGPWHPSEKIFAGNASFEG
jgi:hypothetical protein